MKDSHVSPQHMAVALSLAGEKYAELKNEKVTLMCLSLRAALDDQGHDVDQIFSLSGIQLGQAIDPSVIHRLVQDYDGEINFDSCMEDASGYQLQVTQEIGTAIVAGIVILGLAVICKAEYKDGKWVMNKGLPGLDGVIKPLLKSLSEMGL